MRPFIAFLCIVVTVGLFVDPAKSQAPNLINFQAQLDLPPISWTHRKGYFSKNNHGVTMEKRRSHSDEFKMEAVRRWEEIGNFNEVGRELDLSPSLIRRWRDQLRDEGEQAFPGKGHVRDEEMVQMRRDVARLKEENAILKKAIGYFTPRPR